jgi:predicted transcriptional regulator
MTRDVIFVHHDDPIGLAIQKMKISRRGRLPILKKKKLVGVVSEYDVIKYFAHRELLVKVSDVMTRKPFFIAHTLSLFDVLRILTNTKYRRLPVVENGKVIGIVTASDILKYLRNSDFNTSDLFHPVDSLLRKKVFSVDKHKDLSEAIRKMLVHNVSGLLVLEEGDKLEGIITERDIINQIV